MLSYIEESATALASGASPPPPEATIARLEGIPRDLAASPATSPAPDKFSVALVCREYPPETAFGGMATFTYHLARGLADAGHRVAVVTAGRPLVRTDHDGRVDVVQIQPRLEHARDSFEEMNRRGWLGWGEMTYLHSLGALRAIRELEEAHGPFDVLDLADHCAEGLAPALFWAGPTTVRLYTPWALLASMRTAVVDAGDAATIPLFESALLHHATSITSPSRDLANRVRTFFNVPRPIRFVPNPVDTDAFRPANDDGDGVRVCFVGRFEERKGIRTLLEAIPLVLEKCPDVTFEIVGSDHDGLAATFEPRYRDNVEFRGRVPLSELPAVYQRSTFAVVPSVYDNSPYTAIEPMACGRPVVGTTGGGIPEYVLHATRGLIVPSGDPAALANAIFTLVEDPSRRTEMGRNARSWVVEHLSIPSVADLMINEYQRLLSGAPEEVEAVGPCERTLNREHPELNRVEAIVLAGIEDGSKVEETVESAQREGASVLVVWDGPIAPSFPNAKTTGTSRAAGDDASRILPGLLADCFVVLVAGDVLSPGFLARGRQALARSKATVIEIDGVRLTATAGARGLLFSGCLDWEDVLDRIAQRPVASERDLP
jgi:glycogen(starch) synthase